MNAKSKPFPFWATIFTVLSAIILCSLGTWQIVRLEWKQGLLASLDKEYAKDPLEHPLDVYDFVAKSEYAVKRGVVTGRLVQNKTIALHDAKNGYKIYVPLNFDNGGYKLVYLGTSEKKVIQLPLSSVKITVIGRFLSKPWRFGIKNNLQQNQWVYLDMDDVKAYTGIEQIGGMVLTAETITPPIEGITLTQNHYYPNNNHFKYAFFWFSMCGVLLIIYQNRFWN